jgi:hypothetical protein
MLNLKPMKQMKKIIIISMASIFLMFAGCLNKDDEPIACADILCGHFSGFIETYRNCFNDDNYNCFFVKGVVTDVVGDNRMEIKVLENLKGNFKKSYPNTPYKESYSTTFWWNPYTSGRRDYVAKDTLLIIMRMIDGTAFSCYHGIKRGHYEQVPCAHPILSLSQGYATGIINTDDEIISMPWGELQKLLK